MTQEDYSKLAYSIKNASNAVDLSRAFLFSKIAAGEIKSFKIGAKRFIHAEELARFINSYRNRGAQHDAS